MIDFFGSEEELLANVWLNCEQGAEDIIMTAIEIEHRRRDIFENISNDDFNTDAAYHFLFNIDSIDRLESISI